MTKRQRGPAGEERIHEEIIMDAYGPEEQSMGWYYYLEKLRFPFHDSLYPFHCRLAAQ